MRMDDPWPSLPRTIPQHSSAYHGPCPRTSPLVVHGVPHFPIEITFALQDRERERGSLGLIGFVGGFEIWMLNLSAHNPAPEVFWCPSMKCATAAGPSQPPPSFGFIAGRTQSGSIISSANKTMSGGGSNSIKVRLANKHRQPDHVRRPDRRAFRSPFSFLPTRISPSLSRLFGKCCRGFKSSIPAYSVVHCLRANALI